MKKWMRLSVVVSFLVCWLVSFAAMAEVFKPPQQIGTGNPNLCAVNGFSYYQVVEKEAGVWQFQVFNIMHPVVPKPTATLDLKLAKILAITPVVRNNIIALVDFGYYDGKHRFWTLSINVRDDYAPRAVFRFPAPEGAFALHRSGNWVSVISEKAIQVLNVKDPENFIQRHYQEGMSGLLDVKLWSGYAFLLSRPEGGPPRVAAWELSNNQPSEKIGSVEVGPFVDKLSVVSDFNGAFVLAYGVEQPVLVDRFFLDPKPRLQVRSYCEAFEVMMDGKLRRVAAPLTDNREMIIAITSPDNDRNRLHLATWLWTWNPVQGQYTKKPVVRSFAYANGGWRLRQSAETVIDFPVFIQQFGDELFVYGWNFDGGPLIESFMVDR